MPFWPECEAGRRVLHPLHLKIIFVFCLGRTLSGPDDDFGRVLNKVKGKKMVAEILGVELRLVGMEQARAAVPCHTDGFHCE